jgi:hypothetical protein
MSEINQIPSISTLHQEKHLKESSKHDIFNIVLNKIIQKIIYTNRHTDQTYVIFEIPQILIGYPQYDMKSCLLFVMNKLSNNGYIVEFMQPFYVYIDWGSTINPNKTNTLSSKMPSISGKHKDKLRAQTRALLNQFPNTSQIEFVYEENDKNKKKTNKDNKDNKNNKDNKQQKRLKKNKKK